MTEAKQWTIDVYIDEHEKQTRATARLHNRDETGLVGVGIAACSRPTPTSPRSATNSRSPAPHDLAHQLLEATVTDIESITYRLAHLTN